MSQRETKKYIQEHIANVRKRMGELAGIIVSRAENHDKSKLEEPEFSGFVAMDNEPRYPYGSEEYNDKSKRFAWLFKVHWSKNRHHPEYFDDKGEFEQEANLVDVIEMLCDWVSYNGCMSYTEAYDLVEKQCRRFRFSGTMRNLLLNTLRDYFVDFGCFREKKELHSDYSSLSKKQYRPTVDIKI